MTHRFHPFEGRATAVRSPWMPASAGLAFALALLLAPAASAQFYGGYHESWIACGVQHANERKADKALARCTKPVPTCEEVAARSFGTLRKGRMAQMMPGYAGPWGTVKLSIEFDETGRYASSRVIESPSPTLSGLAIQAAQTWEVYPSCPGGQPGRQTIRMPFHFMVRD